MRVGNKFALGFNSATDQLLWTFFTSFTLAILTAFQAGCFFLAFYRVVRATVNQRHIETSGVDAVILMKGTAWITGGLILGTIETAIGFAQCGFATAIIRRIIRLLSRACLVLGAMKGSVATSYTQAHLITGLFDRVDTVEDFKWMEKGKLRLIGKRSRALAANRRRDYDPRSEELSDVSSDMASIPFRANKGERVTVHFERDQPPTLLLRFSHLDVPTPSAIELNLNPRDSGAPNFDGAGPSSSKPNSRYWSQYDDEDANRGYLGITSTQRPGNNGVYLRPKARFPIVPPLAKTQESSQPSPSLDRTSATYNFRLTTPTSYSPMSETPAVAFPSPSALATGKRGTASISGYIPSTPVAIPSVVEWQTNQPGYGKSFSLSRSNTDVSVTRPPPPSQPALRVVIPKYPTVNEEQTSPSFASSRSSPDIWSPDLDAGTADLNRSDGRDQHFHPDPESPTTPSRTPINPIRESPTRGRPASNSTYRGRTRPSQRPPDEGPSRDMGRIKSIGRVPRKMTPVPTPVQSIRASVRIERVPSPQIRVTMTEDGIARSQPSPSVLMRYGSLSFPSPP